MLNLWMLRQRIELMPIKNYRTVISALKTASEIQEILAKHGVDSVNIEYLQQKPDAIKFSVTIYKQEYFFRLPCNPHGVLETLKRDGVAKTYCNLDRARDISWRIIKDWLDAQLAIIDAGQVTMAEIFFPYLLEANGETIYQKFEYQQRQLNA